MSSFAAAPLTHALKPDVLSQFTRVTLVARHTRSIHTYRRCSRRLHTNSRNLATQLQTPLRARGTRTTAAMSLVDEKHEWGATRVRDTFLNFFKERGHTFGGFRIRSMLWATSTQHESTLEPN